MGATFMKLGRVPAMTVTRERLAEPVTAQCYHRGAATERVLSTALSSAYQSDDLIPGTIYKNIWVSANPRPNFPQ